MSLSIIITLWKSKKVPGSSVNMAIGLMKLADAAVSVPLIASVGAGLPEHLKTLFTETEAQAAIISSMLYSPRLERNYSVSELKEYLLGNKVCMRPAQPLPV
jgi:cyclase